ncbi:MAG: hypothetical protein ACYS6K_12340 [Planctomycetota bacterium]|jgi:hypothetical protein
MEHNKRLLRLNLNLSSLVIGFLLALCLLLVVGASGANDGGTRRYQCSAAGNSDLAVFVIDTESGHTWRLSRTDIYDFGTPSAPRSVRRSIRPMTD